MYQGVRFLKLNRLLGFSAAVAFWRGRGGQCPPNNRPAIRADGDIEWTQSSIFWNHDENAIGDFTDEVDIMGHNEHRSTALSDGVSEQMSERFDPGQIQAVGRFIEDQKFGTGCQGAGDSHSKALPSAQVGDLGMSSVIQPQAAEYLLQGLQVSIGAVE